MKLSALCLKACSKLAMIIVCSLLSFVYAYAVVMGQDLKNLWTIWDQKKTLFFQQKVYGLGRWPANCSKAKMKGAFNSCWVFGFPLKYWRLC